MLALIRMKERLSYSKGVTLIELLVVISIMMTMVAIVAPLTLDTIDKAEAQSEYLAFCGLLRKASVKAFSSGVGIRIELDGNTLRAYPLVNAFSLRNKSTEFEVEPIIEQSYQNLHFASEQVQFNKNGMPNITVFKLKQRNKHKEVNLIALLEN